MDDAVKATLDITRSAGARARTVDITTTGAKTGRARRIEIFYHRAYGRFYLSSLPPARPGWYANLRANPRFTFHLTHGVRTDLAATGVPITDEAERRRILGAIVDDLNQPANPGRIAQPTRVEDWVVSSPLVEVVFDDYPYDT